MQQVYAVSLTAIDLDSNPEAQYLHQLAQGVGMSADACNRIHEQLGAPKPHG
ncbi:MAG: tellurite resistance TerB family protein [Gammaproteobacteria bacterium]|nr:tellurite resistance TerB family protein [Gammaproteobacteria bacterium]